MNTGDCRKNKGVKVPFKFKTNKMSEEKWIECENCNGEGEVYIDTSRQCTTYRNECCGGCGYTDTCEECEGEGEILIED